MTDDPKLRAALGLQAKADAVLPHEHPPRIDFSRCALFPTDKASIAMAEFKSKYGVEAVLCVASNIGNKTHVSAWIVGLIPLDWTAPTQEQADAFAQSATTER